MTSRQRLVVYLVALHVGCFSIVWLSLRGHPGWLLGCEAFLFASLVLTLAWVRSLTEPGERMAEWSRLLEDHDFTIRFRETGPAEVQSLLRVYNRMAAQLRSERVRNQEQEDLYRRVLEVSPTGVLTFDLEGRIQRANPAAIRLLALGAGTAFTDLRGHTCSEIASPLAEAIAALRADEVRLLTVRGHLRVRIRRGSYLDRGFPHEYILIEEFTEEYLRAERSAYGKLVRMMSHEINNTTGAVNSLLESCLHYRDHIPNPDREDFVRALEVSISRNEKMNRFMRGFADVVRLPQPDKEPTDLRLLLGRALDLFREEAKRRRIEVRLESDGPLMANCDPTQIEQALINIVKNAIEAIGEDGVLTARGGGATQLLDAGTPAWIEIEDTGPGLPADVQDHLFTSFFSTKDDGRGLGLTLVREILLGHGCDFSLEAPAPRSTRFRIIFPL